VRARLSFAPGSCGRQGHLCHHQALVFTVLMKNRRQTRWAGAARRRADLLRSSTYMLNKVIHGRCIAHKPTLSVATWLPVRPGVAGLPCMGCSNRFLFVFCYTVLTPMRHWHAACGSLGSCRCCAHVLRFMTATPWLARWMRIDVQL
jgi:hypothetical protein